jgi:signal transduction histidine kinase
MIVFHPFRPRGAPVHSDRISRRLHRIIARVAYSFRAHQMFRPHHIWAAAVASIAVPALLAYLGFRATEEWQRSTRLLVEQRTSEVVTLMIMALNRDMRAVQGDVLPQLESLTAQPAIYDLSDQVTAAFARFPYPEWFFAWTASGDGRGRLFVFTRSDRPPSWRNGPPGMGKFPTTVLKDPPDFQPLIRLLQDAGVTGSHVLALETRFHGEPYQVVARVHFGPRPGAALDALVGFVVNLTWVRKHYFAELLAQLSHVLSANSEISMAVFDEKGVLVTATPTISAAQTGFPAPEQRFPLLFFDPLLRTTVSNEVVPLLYWTARAQPLEGESMVAAARSASRTFVLIGVTALAASLALIFAIISARDAAALAAMKSEFVSSVTHELKTPLSSIRLASETLVRGRYRSQEFIVQYAELLLNEVSRLTRTIDNLLSITRVQDVNGFYLFESVDLLTLLEQALSRFDVPLREQGFHVHLDFPPVLPHVHADRAAILQVLDNLLDNAIRYSNASRFLGVSASSSSDVVSVRIVDKGPGIPNDELPHVFDKFFRGRKTSSAGSGLGLAIAQHILNDHGGSIRLHSIEGQGTTAEVLLCVAKQEKE